MFQQIEIRFCVDSTNSDTHCSYTHIFQPLSRKPPKETENHKRFFFNQTKCSQKILAKL